MATVKLGPTGSIITLPVLEWLRDNQPDLPVTIHKQIEERRMSDGSLRWGFYKKKRQWVWEHGYLSKSKLDEIETLYDYNQTLRFQNNNESSTWYNVIFFNFDYGPVRTDILNLERYWCWIVLREA